jgi:hypothetical protein
MVREASGELAVVTDAPHAAAAMRGEPCPGSDYAIRVAGLGDRGRGWWTIWPRRGFSRRAESMLIAESCGEVPAGEGLALGPRRARPADRTARWGAPSPPSGRPAPRRAVQAGGWRGARPRRGGEVAVPAQGQRDRLAIWRAAMPPRPGRAGLDTDGPAGGAAGAPPATSVAHRTPRAPRRRRRAPLFARSRAPAGRRGRPGRTIAAANERIERCAEAERAREGAAGSIGRRAPLRPIATAAAVPVRAMMAELEACQDAAERLAEPARSGIQEIEARRRSWHRAAELRGGQRSPGRAREVGRDRGEVSLARGAGAARS